MNIVLHPSHWWPDVQPSALRVELERFKAEGLNSIRPVHYMWRYAQLQGPDTINEEGFSSTMQQAYHRLVASIDDTVRMCTELNMILVLDLHTSDYHPAPEWAQALGCPTHGRFPTWDFLLSGSSGANECLRGIQNAWGLIARRYASNRHIAFNIWNEPSIRDLSPSIGVPNYKNFMEDCLATIRANESVRHDVIIPEYFGLWEKGYSDDIIGDARTYRDTHIYDPFQTPYNRATQRSLIESRVQNRIDYLTNTGLKLLVGEFGRRVGVGVGGDGGDLEWIEDAFDVFKAYGVEDLMYFAWTYSTTAEYSIINPDGTPIDPYYGVVMSSLYSPTTPIPPFSLAQAIVAGGTAYATTGRLDYALAASVIGGLIKRKEQG